jgi:mannosyl-3-phosphoglycerate phosphatase family protein
MKSQFIIFTDLDGTLLDYHTYSFAAAASALKLIARQQIPLVLCSSKTRAEIEHWREKLNNLHPFVSENGGGIFIPHTYFPANDLQSVWPKTEMADGYAVLVLGTPYIILRETLEELRKDGFEIKGFGDLDAAEVAQITELNPEEAALAKMREFDEPFVFAGEKTRLPALLAAVEKKGLHCIAGGRLFHLTGNSDKGKAVEILMQLYRKKLGEIPTLGLGDSPNDFPMLEHVDYPILVRNHRGEHDPRLTLPNLIKADGIGPEGWAQAVIDFLQEDNGQP